MLQWVDLRQPPIRVINPTRCNMIIGHPFFLDREVFIYRFPPSSELARRPVKGFGFFRGILCLRSSLSFLSSWQAAARILWMLPLTCLPLLQGTDFSSSAKEKGASLGLLVLVRGQNYLGMLLVKSVLMVDLSLCFHPRDMRSAFRREHLVLGLNVFIGPHVPHFPGRIPRRLVVLDVT